MENQNNTDEAPVVTLPQVAPEGGGDAKEVPAEDQTAPAGTDGEEPAADAADEKAAEDSGNTVIQRDGVTAVVNAAGELQPIVASAEEVKAAEEPVKVEVVNQVNVAPPIPHDANQLPISVGAAARQVIAELHDYIESMSTKKLLSSEVGARNQASLYRALIGAVNSPAEDFKPVMDLVLKMIADRKGDVFSYENVFRFLPHMTLPPANILVFRALVNLFTALADPASRGLAMKQIDFNATLEHRTIREDARQRVLSYFNVQ